ncbi:MAG TPA: hypothetical protein VKL22_03950 [Actinomycetota bacterium]|nr:hypothetical protein [Actinomycetota bacterium]
MELDGHPTHDLVGELQTRGAYLYPGTGAGPDSRYQDLQPPPDPDERGLWLYLPPEVYDTGFDEPPPLT